MHFLLMALFCLAVGGVLGAMLRDTAREAVALGAWIAVGMIVIGLAVAWVMYFLP